MSSVCMRASPAYYNNNLSRTQGRIVVKKAKTILVAEDDRTTRSVMKQVLESDGYKVIEGDRGEKSLFLAKAAREFYGLMQWAP